VIIGLGNDLVDIRRIAKVLERHGERFLEKVFCGHERDLAMRRADPAATLAKRFAAREAAAKALGTGFRAGVEWRDICVACDDLHRPSLVFSGGAAVRLAAVTPAGMTARAHLSMTDEYPYAQAVVILEAV
jgi:holo-[acyl-carrier protein] synthase